MKRWLTRESKTSAKPVYYINMYTPDSGYSYKIELYYLNCRNQYVAIGFNDAVALEDKKLYNSVFRKLKQLNAQLDVKPDPNQVCEGNTRDQGWKPISPTIGKTIIIYSRKSEKIINKENP